MNRHASCGWRVVLACLAFSLTSRADEAPVGMVKLDFDLPKPLTTGTPKNLSTPHLEKTRFDAPRAAIYMPPGCTNVALKKKVISSDKEPVIGSLDLVTDGDREGAEGSYVELGPGIQWVQIDLGKSCEVWAVVFWHFHSEGRIYRGVVVQISDDSSFKTATTIFNNDQENQAGLGAGKDLEYTESYRGRPVPVKGIRGRYVRLYSNGNTSNQMNHYIEVEVYGK